MLAILSRGILRTPHLDAFLGEEFVFLRPGARPAGVDGVVAWGRRPSARSAESYAARHGITRVLWLEDGFIRSVGPGQGFPACSMVIDDLGIYYDAASPSRFEHLVAMPLSGREHARARQLIARWREAGVSKYNHAPAPAMLPQSPYVLVVDQTIDDASVRHGLADAGSFQRMLLAAIESYPGCRIVVKEHPEVFAGRKRGYLGELLDKCPDARVQRLADDVHVVPLLRAATAVFTVTSQVGFEALLHGKPVHTFGMPFYAGWGLTADCLPRPERRRPVSLDQLSYAALVRYARYVHPHTADRCEAEDIIDYLALQRRMRQQFPVQLHAVGFSRWKRPILRGFLQGSQVRFHRSIRTVPRGAQVLIWGRTHDLAGRHDLSAITVEDGFLRSVGLGAQCVRPISWVFDRSGIYYDVSMPSELERLLNEAEFDKAILTRAARLRAAIVQGGLTKYNVGQGNWRRPAGGREVILVVGQVEADASLRYGSPGIRTNRDLLEAVRAHAPNAYLAYKAHPDVHGGLRGRRTAEAGLRAWCDEMVSGYPMQQLVGEVDEVHVMTSLAGFEALLRGKRVTVHGAPFYAGWGLTEDRCAPPRRRRTLSLDMLVAAALILYPRYLLRDAAMGFATPEEAIAHLLRWRQEPAARGLRFLRQVAHPFWQCWHRWRDARGQSAKTPT